MILNLAKYVSQLVGEIEAHGLRVDLTHDPDRLAAACAARDAAESQTMSLTEPFSARYFDLGPGNFMSLLVMDGERVVSAQGARLDLLGQMNLAAWWQQQQKRIYVDPYPNQSPALGREHSPDASLITGRVVYHGNMWLLSDMRGKRLAQPICRLGQILAALQWQPDYIYCFIEARLVAKGFAAHQGYAHISPAGTHWLRAPEHIHGDDYLCWNRMSDLQHLARASIEYP